MWWLLPIFWKSHMMPGWIDKSTQSNKRHLRYFSFWRNILSHCATGPMYKRNLKRNMLLCELVMIKFRCLRTSLTPSNTPLLSENSLLEFPEFQRIVKSTMSRDNQLFLANSLGNCSFLRLSLTNLHFFFTSFQTEKDSVVGIFHICSYSCLQ